ncbi:unnamed protein product [Bursaphelenchus okinawaensis]|uniref:Uncharacterized protein n=1 Tax=Bursaphelenchus okinawaensis TaxID=465554 RepID=A0A811KAL1_9BILA|nr:unnamed protein product [Bursaphelenchus okinawaensis]CAG9095741.1 unnamed protein product [Bursaphelenchus okinawaensis]
MTAALRNWLFWLPFLAAGVVARECLSTTPLTVSGECGEEEVSFQATVKNNQLAIKLKPGNQIESKFNDYTRITLNVGGCEIEVVLVPGLFVMAQTTSGFSSKADDLLVIVEHTGNYSLFSPSDSIRRFFKCPSKEVEFESYGSQKFVPVTVKLSKKEPTLKLEVVDSKLWTVSSSNRLAVMSISFILTFISLIM